MKSIKRYEIMLLVETHNSSNSVQKSLSHIIEKSLDNAKQQYADAELSVTVESFSFVGTQSLKYSINSISMGSYYCVHILSDPISIKCLIKEMLKHKIIMRFVCLDYKKKIAVIEKFDYKCPDKYISKMISDTGQILPRSKTGLCKKDNKNLATSIKIARFMATCPFVVD